MPKNDKHTLQHWQRILYVWLHDPVDKALDIPGHMERAARYATTALGSRVSYKKMQRAIGMADILAATADRLPMPTAGRNGERAVGLIDGKLKIRHPVSAEEDELSGLSLCERKVNDVIGGVVGDLPANPRLRFLALWRLLPDRLATDLGLSYMRLPADTRVPDHTLIQHADITSGIASGLQEKCGYAYLSLSLGPVQTFIKAARSVHDLWSGSAILSWLVFQGLLPVIKAFGPTALVFPALRGNPLMDMWLRKSCGIGAVPLPPNEARMAPSLPNRFVAIVPWGPDGKTAMAMADDCERSIRSAWSKLAEKVRLRIDLEFSRIDPNWASRWHAQVESFFEITTTVAAQRELTDNVLAELIGSKAEFHQVWPKAASVRRMSNLIPQHERPAFNQQGAGQWQAQLEASARLMEAQRSLRHVPALQIDAASPPKCSLLGSYEQMGPSGLKESGSFWRQAWNSSLPIRDRERLCAIALCKRFAAQTTLIEELQLDPATFGFPNTATVAKADWSVKPTLPWSGRWRHQRSRNDVNTGESEPPQARWNQIRATREQIGAPPAYYAILSMDADQMGLWLKGEKAPRVRSVMHSKMVDYFSQLGSEALESKRPVGPALHAAISEALESKRPVGPALHAAISEALNNFASHIAPNIVRKYRGTMIYSGGDDVLALLPLRRIVACASELYDAFRGGNGDIPGWTRVNGRDYLVMGKNATLSAGIAFVHYKDDLRGGLEAARKAERISKENGRDRLTLKFMRRSGEQSQVGFSWTLAPWFQNVVDAFVEGASDRWVYHLRRELPTLKDEELPAAAVNAEVARLVARTQDGAAPSGENLHVDQWWAEFRKYRGQSLDDYVKLCQGASFVARGQDA